MLKLLWRLIELLDDNWGYSTPIQKRFEIGDVVRISKFKSSECKFDVGDNVTILETGSHDYLVRRNNVLDVLYQYELEPKKN
jgi:hypothetical protein